MDENLSIQVHPDAPLPAEVVRELESFRARRFGAGKRGLAADVVANALGGIIASGLWDVLPVYARFLLGSTASSPLASSEQVAERVLETLRAAGVAGDGDPVVSELVNGPGDGWTGMVTLGSSSVSFHSSAEGDVVAYRVLP